MGEDSLDKNLEGHPLNGLHGEIQNVSKERSQQKCWKVFKTVVMSLSMLVLSLFFEIPGPTLPYLKDRIQVNYEEVSRVLVARSVGYFPGTIMAGFMYDAYPKMSYFFVFTLLLIAAVGIAVSPWCGSLELLGFVFFLQGISHSNLNAGMNALVIRMWGRQSGPVLVSQAFLTGMGGLVASQLTNTFIKVRTVQANPNDTLSTGQYVTPNQPESLQSYSTSASLRPTGNTDQYTIFYPNTMEISGYNGTSTKDIFEGHTLPKVLNITVKTVIEEAIEYPYVITASICGFLALIYLGIFITELFMQKTNGEKNKDKFVKRTNCADVKRILSPSTCTGGHPKYGTAFFVLLILLHLHLTGSIRLVSLFLYSFARYSAQSFSPSQASNLNSAFWLSYTVSRGLNTVVAICCPVTVHFAVMMLLNIITCVILTIWGTENTMMLWIFTCVYGFAMSPLFPLSFIWANLYVEMTAVAVSTAYLGSAFGGIIYQWFAGFLFENLGPPTLFYILLGSSVNIVIVYLVLQVLAHRHGPRGKKAEVVDITEL